MIRRIAPHVAEDLRRAVTLGPLRAAAKTAAATRLARLEQGRLRRGWRTRSGYAAAPGSGSPCMRRGWAAGRRRRSASSSSPPPRRT